MSRKVLNILTPIIAILLIAMGLTTYQRFEALQVRWNDYQKEVAHLENAISEFNNFFGYGGFIHLYKNLVIRADLEFTDKIDKIKPEIKSSLSKIFQSKHLTDNSKHFQVLERTINLYFRKYDQLVFNIQKGIVDTRSLDALAYVDDKDAIEALNIIRTTIESGSKLKLQSISNEFIKSKNQLLLMASFIWVMFVVYAYLFFRSNLNLFKLSSFLSEKEHELNTLIESAPNGIISFDKKGKILRANKAVERIFGFTSEELRNVDQFIPMMSDNSHDNLAKLFIKHKDYKENAESFNVFGKTKTGEKIALDIGLFIADKNNKKITNAVIRDVTDLVKNQKELVIAKKEAEAANNAKSEFLAIMGHEIRTPLNSIIGLSEAIQEINTDNTLKPYLKRIHRNGEHLYLLVNDILDFTKIEFDKVELEDIEFNFNQLTSDVLSIFEDKANDKGINLKLNYPNDMAHYFSGDPTRVYQVISNFISNALKFSEKGDSITLHVKEKDGIYVVVEDQGCGIPQDKQGDIFKKFEQADKSTTRKYGGTGLGLSICQKLVELMGGKIGVQSEPDKGSKFWFSIPLKEANDVTATMNFETLLAPSTVLSDSEKLSILVVDDAIDNRFLFQTFMNKYGHDVDEAENGQVAIDLYKKKNYDIIFMDMQMPVLDGMKATQIIREIEKIKSDKQIPIIALSALDKGSNSRKCIDAGCNDYLSKPYKKKELLEMIEKHLSPILDIDEKAS